MIGFTNIEINFIADMKGASQMPKLGFRKVSDILSFPTATIRLDTPSLIEVPRAPYLMGTRQNKLVSTYVVENPSEGEHGSANLLVHYCAADDHIGQTK